MTNRNKNHEWIMWNKRRKETQTVDISKLNKAKVLAALYNASKYYFTEDMTEQEAAQILSEYKRFDYLKGQVMKVDLSSDRFDPRGYDHNNGQGAAESVINKLRGTE